MPNTSVPLVFSVTLPLVLLLGDNNRFTVQKRFTSTAQPFNTFSYYNMTYILTLLE